MSEARIKEIVAKHHRWIEKHLEYVKAREAFESSLSKEKIDQLKLRAKEYLTMQTSYYAKIMSLKFGRITITSAKTRFGSCNNKGDISYSYRLMLYPEAAIQYVIVHELAHTVYMNHSKDFYDLIEVYLPDWRERKKLLKILPN